MANNGNIGRPQNVGIVAIEVYFPNYYVNQAELEAHDGVAAGKYTIGLGLNNMGFCSDREDINSLSLTVMQRLMERNNLSYDQIGRLEVGTETIVDKSKSTKTVLMQLFKDSGNSEVEGIDTTNACYGGTNALFNSINWVESNSWDGRYAVVVCGDIAIYSVGSARCTGGAGACAMLIGPDAPVVMESRLRGSHMQHVYDFYKPNMTSEYPTVDGKLSLTCYTTSVDKCYQRYKDKAATILNKKITLDTFDKFCFHSPFCKLVQKSVGRITLNDFLIDPERYIAEFPELQNLRDVKIDETYTDKNIEKTFVTVSNNSFKQKTKGSLLLAGEVGNMYTASLYGGLASLFAISSAETLAGKRIGMFSYGSGSAATLYSFRVVDDATNSKLINIINNAADIPARLESRKKVSPDDFVKTLAIREDNHSSNNYSPVGSTEDLCPGTYYLAHVDDMYRRRYERKPLQNSNGI
ncbi:uncharacterized protein TRIADDRAFT_27878 [Trichoplax adhaerens]|uniref:Hydroxymethylglutaryl-CoA synthase n=1 Tax=Trichoplax adhaerens TaxID=10228 RepID=B3S1Q3_TRIAD|nr:hypothetical protein TRIADDRAFT_27878 [Trichoplax adhaerens]EDV23014.1 hypothetical protein TRIADDRAFT_27878 [Trichoplax adhaerens]|eukprot:XP_002113924.1 hypothetical protein TRIADDRAFT_27878 [Trichoplax adhaerens]